MNWTATSLIAGDTLHMPEIGIEVPVAEFYERVDFPIDARRAAEGEPPGDE